MLSSQTRERSSRGRRTVARYLHHVVDVAGQREAETVDCRFRLLGVVGWRDAADAGVVVVGWTGGAPAFFGGKGAARPREPEHVTIFPDFCGQQMLQMSATAVTPRPLLYFSHYIFPAGQRRAVRFMQSRQAARSMKC